MTNMSLMASRVKRLKARLLQISLPVLGSFLVSCSNDNSRNQGSVATNAGTVFDSNKETSEYEGDSVFSKVLTTKDKGNDKGQASNGLVCDKYGICAYFEPASAAPKQMTTVLQTETLTTTYKDLPFEFSPTDKVNEFGRFIMTLPSFDNSGMVNDLIPLPSATASSSQNPSLSLGMFQSVNWFVSATSKSFNHCFVTKQDSATQSSATRELGRFPGMNAVYGSDATGHWIFANRILANTLGPAESPIWHKVEVVSEVLSIQGKNPIELPKNEMGMRFSTWMVSQVPYSIKSSVVLHPEDAFAGAAAAPVEIEITTAWGLPHSEQNAFTRAQNAVLTFSQVWECEAGAPCPKLLNDVPLYWYEETLAKGLGRSWKIKDKLTNSTWNGANWRASDAAGLSCNI